MLYERLKYNKLEINNTGRILIKENISDKERDKALEILDNWRAVHSYPMNIFKKRLKIYAKKVDSKCLTAQRLKRVPAILNKLKRGYDGRKPSMKLYQMQDIGGCRAVLSTVENARKLYNDYYIKGDLKHKLVNKKDYISNPKNDGYRGLHLVYSYKSDKGKKEFNSLLVEVQIRTKLQHIWATSIETVDFFTRQAIKSNEGHPDWMEFFKLVSSAFAKMENCSTVPNTPEDKKELYTKIKQKAIELNVIEKMRGWTSAIKFFDEEIRRKNKIKAKFFLLELDILGKKLSMSTYKEEDEERAINEYSALEKRHIDKKDYDVVLVGVDKVADLRKAYPNYFLDSKEFLSYLEKIMNEA
jgi:ppGpp synthetase/RelA/SpoT-type nucleotidyltranferase